MNFTGNTLQIINNRAENDVVAFVTESENEYMKNIRSVADRVAADDDIKIISIAGPSASGKTTTAHILCEQLKLSGENPVVISLDDFYLTVDKLPVLPNGKRDTESVNSLDSELLSKCFTELIKNGFTKLPRYDFSENRRILNYRTADIRNKGIAIVEGLHAINPAITNYIPEKNILKIYISVNDSIYDGKKQLLSSRQLRLVRRVLRDRIFRNTPLNSTLDMWNGVVDGERKYLYCFKEKADIIFKTLHSYEPCVYRDEFISLESEIICDNVCYEYFMRTVSAMKEFKSIDRSYIPDNSLIREFVGNGIYKS